MAVPTQKITPLDWRTPMVNPDGTPSSQFLRLWQQLFGNTDNNEIALEGKADKTETISSVPGETTGGGDLSAPRTIGLADTAVIPGSYTSANITVDQKGRLTAASNGSGGGGGVYMPVVDGSLPPNLIYLPDGNLVYVQVA